MHPIKEINNNRYIEENQIELKVSKS